MNKAITTDLGDVCKSYEDLSPGNTRLMAGVPVCARLDGKAFHTFTRGLPRPFSQELHDIMVETTKLLLEKSDAVIGYTQSDEITLIWDATKENSQMYFDGRVAKLNSVLASMATARFNKLLPSKLPSKVDTEAYFDCRIWSVPNRTQAINNLLWREADASKNSVSMAARAVFSHKELQGKSSKEMKDMLIAKGINWNNYPASFKRGSYVRRTTITRKFTTAELAALPAKHDARANPDLTITRHEIEVLNPPILSRVTNLEDFVFNSATPTTA